MEKANAYMYVLQCNDDTLYTGYTTDINRRLLAHNNGKGAKYTKMRLPVTLLYAEEFPDKSSALKAEAAFKKKSRQEKLTYITNNQKQFLLNFNTH